MRTMAFGTLLILLAVGLSPYAFAANKDEGKQIDDHTWQGRASVEQDIPRISINNKIIKLILSDKADQNAKDTFKDPSKFKVKGHGFMKATVTGTMTKNKEGEDVIAVDTIKLEEPEQKPAKNGGNKGGDAGKKKKN